MRLTIRTSVVLLLFATVAMAQATHPLTLEDLFALKRVGAPALSPDGVRVAFTITDVDLAADRGKTDIWIVRLDNQEMRRLTAATSASYNPVWKPDGTALAFLRGGQIWLIDIGGGEARQISNAPNGVDGFNWSPDGTQIIFSSMTWPGCDDECQKKKAEEQAKNKVTARVATELLYRHWSTWRTDGMKSHLFILDVASGAARDILPDARYDMPPFPFGGSGDYTFSPDGKEIAFVAKTEADPATHTNLDVFILSLAGGEPKCITAARKGQDSGSLVFSPDGRYLAWGGMERARFESDQVDIILFDRTTGATRNLTEKFDRYIAEWAFAPDGKNIYAIALNQGRRPVFRIPLEGGEPKEIVGGGYLSGLQVTPDGKTLVYAFRNLRTPSTIHAYDLEIGMSRELTPVNKDMLATLQLGEVRDYWFDGANGDKVQIYVVLPPGFDAKQKYPLLQIIHGGPQQDYADLWTFDWNSQFFAARGYVVGLVCFHGTPGYGQAFTDAITKNWGGAPYEDMMKGTDFLIAQGFVDPNRLAAGGGSYGGYLTNWIATQTDRFKALVSHAGLWNLESMYGATEELWFPEWELNGPYWEDRTLYDKWSPHRYAANLKTPMLITHGEQDFRVPVTQGLEIFTALRRQGIPATLVYYPDEHHWTQRQQNKAFWYKEFMKLLDTYVK